MDALPRPAAFRLLAAWLLIGGLFTLGLGAPGGRAEEPLVVGAVLFALGALVGLGARSSLYLAAARRGLVPLAEGAPPHRLWRRVPASLAAGLLASAPGVTLGALVAAEGAPRAGLIAGSVVVTLLGFLASAALARRDVARPAAPRDPGLFRWLVIDTALPAALLAAALGAAIGWVRLSGDDKVAPPTLARHLAVTLFLYGGLIGPAAALKAGREKLAGLVVTKAPARALPGPLTAGGLLGVVLLFAGPWLLPALPAEVVIAGKAILGLVVGGALALLGAWRGAQAR